MSSYSFSSSLSASHVWKIVSESDEYLQPVRLPAEVQSLDQISTYLPPGAYTTLRTYLGDRALRLSDHVMRLERSASLTEKSMVLDEGLLRRTIRKAISLYRDQVLQVRKLENASNAIDYRIRLTLQLTDTPGDIYLAIETLPVPPPNAYIEGVPILTTSLKRILPQAKLTRFIGRSQSVRQSLQAGINEAVMLDESGFLMEGISSNFFAVWKGEIWTADSKILPGITRTIVLEQAAELAFPVVLKPIHQDQIPAIDEAFITSSSRGVLPVRQIDQHIIGAGEPGASTKNLMQAYERVIEEQAQPI